MNTLTEYSVISLPGLPLNNVTLPILGFTDKPADLPVQTPAVGLRPGCSPHFLATARRRPCADPGRPAVQHHRHEGEGGAEGEGEAPSPGAL